MRKFIYVIIGFMFISCDSYLPGFDFKIFKGTKAYELSLAVESQNKEEIEKIINKDSSLIDYLDPKFGHSLLMLSVANNLNISVEKLLKLGANPNKRSKSIYNSEVTTPVFISVNDTYKNNCNTKSLELLVKYGGKIDDGIDVNYLNSNYITKETPLMIATQSNCLDMVKKIVELGADINDYDYVNGKGPLANCIIHDNLNILKYLVIDKKIRIPNYVFVRHAYKNKPREELTLQQFLNEQDYKKDSKNYKYRTQILGYLENR